MAKPASVSSSTYETYQKQFIEEEDDIAGQELEYKIDDLFARLNNVSIALYDISKMRDDVDWEEKIMKQEKELEDLYEELMDPTFIHEIHNIDDEFISEEYKELEYYLYELEYYIAKVKDLMPTPAMPMIEVIPPRGCHKDGVDHDYSIAMCCWPLNDLSLIHI